MNNPRFDELKDRTTDKLPRCLRLKIATASTTQAKHRRIPYGGDVARGKQTGVRMQEGAAAFRDGRLSWTEHSIRTIMTELIPRLTINPGSQRQLTPGIELPHTRESRRPKHEGQGKSCTCEDRTPRGIQHQERVELARARSDSLYCDMAPLQTVQTSLAGKTRT